MFEPHLGMNDPSGGDNKSFNDDSNTSAKDLLAELDRIAPIKAFDAFPKVQSTYTERSRRGGILTALVGGIIFLLILNDLGEFMFGAPTFSFHVDPTVDTKELQLNVDLTVAMPCHYLSIDVRDVVGDRLHLSDDFVKDGTVWETGRALNVQSWLINQIYEPDRPAAATIPSANQVVHDAHRGSRTPLTLPKPTRQTSTSSGLRRIFSSLFGSSSSSSSQPVNPNVSNRRPPSPKDNLRRNIKGFRKTENWRPTEGPEQGKACRVYGSVGVKRVTGNLHVTTLGHGYMSWEHTGHDLMNLSHIIHEFSFGPFFPAIAQPLDMTYVKTEEKFPIFQYFLSVVPTTYIDSSRRKIQTSQYAVTDYSRTVEHGRGVPGIFFKFDLEALSMTVEERTTTLYQFLIRLAGVIGGVWTTAAFALRILTRAEKEVKVKVLKTEKPYTPSVLPSPGGGGGGGGMGSGKMGMARRSSSYFGQVDAGYR
ncbi:endoplasmic reticulum vesicle transporter-domain-containing protein [Filobasidium floriforme]|uniref:endoplasmic reticulum vesicle transporter-domain-containing protein n=1 Tax=Filobasidium floriforme TaxID=5210 RepID=UPI001E8CE020|nr:endoplasmic reticulum vesicle transporter-domain-containing protein [Filobasidium floriforme]KAH8088999.1 endoplasmic reticulum vesicle transporter-domain-containing protein [Filobasidium floriforme]